MQNFLDSYIAPQYREFDGEIEPLEDPKTPDPINGSLAGTASV
jgi:hypothetical protein